MGVYPLFFKDFVFYPVFLSPWVGLEGILSAVHGRALLGGEGALPGAAVEAEGLKTDVPDSALPGWGDRAGGFSWDPMAAPLFISTAKLKVRLTAARQEVAKWRKQKRMEECFFLLAEE